MSMGEGDGSDEAGVFHGHDLEVKKWDAGVGLWQVGM
jgi:hypothetical protein